MALELSAQKNASLEDFDPPVKARKNRYAIAIASLASMTSVLLGYDIGVISGAIIYIRRDLNINDVQVEVLVGILNLYSLVGSFLAGRTSDWIGRRYTIVLAGGIFFVGAVLMGFSTSYGFLMFGRFIAGVGVGYALQIAPVYAGEISPADSRGMLTSLPEVYINFGILLGYVSNLAFSKLPLWLGWRVMLGIGIIPAILIALGVLIMPESPRWLVMKGRLGEAHRVLQKISVSEEEAQQRLADIKSAAEIPESCNGEVVEVPKNKKVGKGVWKEMFITPSPAVRHIIIAVIGIHFFQQAVGLDSVVLYSPTIFEKAGITSDSQRLGATIGVGVTKTMFILVATFLLDRFGRRPLLLTSFAGLIASLFTLGTCLTVITHTNKKVPVAVVLSITTVLSSVASFSVGAGPIAWVYCTEVLPLRLRGQGTGMGVVVNRSICALISMTFLSLSKAITIGGAFYLYGTIATIGFIFFYFVLPETRGKTLEEMEGIFGNFKATPAAKDVVAANDRNDVVAKASNPNNDGNDKAQGGV